MRAGWPALLGLVATACPAPEDSAQPVDLWTNTIDVHTHIKELEDEDDLDQIADAIEDAIEDEALQLLMLMPPPGTPDPDNPGVPVERLLEALGEEREPIAFLGGGGSLNPMLQRATLEGSTGEELRATFEDRALELVQLEVLGFGELALEHLSLGVDHPYLHAPADHELMLLLADIAAEHDLPIDVHMEAVTQDLTLSQDYTDLGNPEVLEENIAAFERLLEHNRSARIIWSHAGWDNTGQRTPELTERLLDAHPNLYLSIKVGEDCPEAWSIVDGKGTIRDDWQALLASHPERFMLGADNFFVPLGLPSLFEPDRIPTDLILDQLPLDVAEWVGHETAVVVFGLQDRTF
jgi:hypothetical protein